MKIALTRREYITHLDGVNKFIELLVEGLAKLGHEPVIVSCAIEVLRERSFQVGLRKSTALT